MGWANRVFESDSSYISYVIAVIFLVLWVFSLFIGSWVNKQLNDLILNEGSQIYDEYSSLLKKRFELPKNQNFDHSILASTLQVKLNLKIKIISYVANLLILLGLIGTVIGFIVINIGVFFYQFYPKWAENDHVHHYHVLILILFFF